MFIFHAEGNISLSSFEIQATSSSNPMPKLRTFINYDLTVSPKRLGKTLRVTKKSRKAARRKCQVVFNTSTKSENSTFSRVSANANR